MKKVFLILAISLMLVGCDKITNTLNPTSNEVAPTSATEPVSK